MVSCMPVPAYFRKSPRPLDLPSILNGMTASEALFEVGRGGTFVMFQFCISLLIVTIRRNTRVHFVRAGDHPGITGMPYTLLTLLLGWWEIPWGLIYTPQIIFRNIKGGTDVTDAVVAQITTMSSGAVGAKLF